MPANTADHASTVRELHASQYQRHIHPVSAPLHVVVGLSNPMRFESRYRLFEAFRKYIEDSGGILTTVELATGDRHFQVTSRDNPRDVQVRSRSVLWHKENLLRIAMQHLSLTDPGWSRVAWVDSDTTFARTDWVQETLHLLEIHPWLQMWSHAIDMGPDHQPIGYASSLMFDHVNSRRLLAPLDHEGKPKPHKPPKYGHGDPPPVSGAGHIGLPQPWHPGYAWAARRDAIDAVGGLGDIGILGAGDHHMGWALLGQVERSMPKGIHPSYRTYWKTWERLAEAHVRRNVGVMNTTLFHAFHGRKSDRRYAQRWDLLTAEPKYDWTLDIRRDSQGVIEWTHNNRELQHQVYAYFEIRREDSVDWP